MLKVAAPAVSANTTPAGGAAASPVPRDMDSVPAQPAAAADKPAAEAPSRTFSGPPKPEVTASGHIIVYDALGQPIKRKVRAATASFAPRRPHTDLRCLPSFQRPQSW